VDVGLWEEVALLPDGVAWPEASAEPFEFEGVFPISPQV
jgi:hypothetical protein